MLPTPTTRTRTSPMLPSPLASIAFRRIIACGRTAGNRPGGKRLASEERGLMNARPASGSFGFAGRPGPSNYRPLGFVRVPEAASLDRFERLGFVRSRARPGLGDFRPAWVRSVPTQPGFGRLRLGSFGFQRLPVWTRSSGLGLFGIEGVGGWATSRPAWVRSGSDAAGFVRFRAPARVRSDSRQLRVRLALAGSPPARADNLGMPRAGMLQRFLGRARRCADSPRHVQY